MLIEDDNVAEEEVEEDDVAEDEVEDDDDVEDDGDEDENVEDEVEYGKVEDDDVEDSLQCVGTLQCGHTVCETSQMTCKRMLWLVQTI